MKASLSIMWSLAFELKKIAFISINPDWKTYRRSVKDKSATSTFYDNRFYYDKLQVYLDSNATSYLHNLAPFWVSSLKKKKNILSADNWHVYTFVKLQVTSFIFSDLSILTWHMFCKNNVQKSINSLYECVRIL